MKTFTIMGHTVNTAEQARTVLLAAMLKGDTVVSKQCMSVIAQLS